MSRPRLIEANRIEPIARKNRGRWISSVYRRRCATVIVPRVDAQKSVFLFLARWLREPLVHFLIIGGILFAAYSAFSTASIPGAGSKHIELTVDDLRQLEIAFASQWQRPPTSQEFAGLVEDHIREEVLYREALALGLDKDDSIVKRRMAQKMGFLTEDLAATRQPTMTELKAWFDRNPQRFAVPPRATFRLPLLFLPTSADSMLMMMR